MDATLTPSRRTFLGAVGALAADGLAAGDGPRPAIAPDPPRALKPSSADLGSLFADVDRLAGAPAYDLSFVGDRFRRLEDFQKAARPRVLELLLYRPEKVDPRPEVIDRTDCGAYVREKVAFSTTPHFRVPAYVLVPKGLTKPAPAVLDLHSHGGMFLFGKEKVVDLDRNHPAMVEYHRAHYDGRPTAAAFARRGYVVISIDAFMFGERRLLLDADLKYGWDRSKYSLDDVRHLNAVCRAKEPTLVKGLTLAGTTWPGLVFWDDMRTVDYLLTRPEVDAARLGCVGVSMGGYRSCYLAALDGRIAAACVTGFMSTVRPMVRAHLDIHSLIHFLPGLSRALDLPDVATLHAPKPLLVQQCARDQLFPPEGMKEAVKKIAAVYEKAGARDRFTARSYEVPHQFSRPMQDEALDWFDRQLK
jgi:dienelactone hydrolase